MPKAASSSAFGAPRVPLTVPSPEALPSINTGPTWNGPSACQLVFKAIRAPGPITPLAWIPAAAPSTAASPSCTVPPDSAALSRSFGEPPNRRSSSPRPERNFDPLPSAVISQGFLAPDCAADQFSTRLPADPGCTRSRPEIVAEPLKLSPPRRPTEPLPEATSPWPFRSALRISIRPSLKRTRSKASLGLGPPSMANMPVPPPPSPARLAFTASSWALPVTMTGPETLASR